MSSKFHTVGQVYRDFKLTRLLPIQELQCHLYELVHLPTEARVMHIANEDPENLFCLSFQTLPDSSNGVAHILEHTVLCGSKKFPVKDPFFAMTRRSLNTFMNALTGADFTCFPAATQVPKDFYNLLEVYLDAVFHPILNRFSFLQEGHRLEFAKPDDPSSPLEHKGVVFNEMKGALSSPGTRLGEEMHAALFPNITYGFNSGGTPRDIAELTYEELIAFHRKFYHPSRCLFFFYGNMALEGHLDFIAKQALEGVTKGEPLPAIPNQPRFLQPRRFQTLYPISSDEEERGKSYLSFAWLTSHVQEQEELLALSILEIILLDTDASPLKKALLKSGLCKLVSSHIDTDVHENPLMINLRGCEAESAEACEQVIRETLEQIVRQGIPLDQVENAIHQLEFFRSEITGDHIPFGLSLFMRSALLKQHKVDPEEGLKIHTLFDGVRKKAVENPNYFGLLIQKYLLDNPHFVRIVMAPNRDLGALEQAHERAELDQIQAALTAEESAQLVKQAQDLQKFQKMQEEEDINILPKVTLDDVPKMARDFPLTREKQGNLEIFHHSCFTNKIVYCDLVFPLPDLKEEDLPFVRLFTTLLFQMGSGERNYEQNLEFIQANTGGMSASLVLNQQAADHTRLDPALHLRGKALHRKSRSLFTLLNETTTSPNFKDKGRLKEVLQKHYTALESSLNQNALKYAINLSSSGLDKASKIGNSWYGLDYYHKIKQFDQKLDLDLLVDQMERLKERLLNLDNPHLVITCEAAFYDELKGHEFYGLTQLQTQEYMPWKGDFTLPEVETQGRQIPTPIAFTSKVLRTVPYVHPDSPALAVAACLFDNLILHPKVREQGGAYGGGASSHSTSAIFYFYSYRDPNINSTLKAFEIAVQEMLKGHFDEQDLQEAKLEIIQSLDDPIAPGSRGDYAYGWLREGKTTEVRQAYRDRVLALTRKDVMQAIKAHIEPQMAKSATVVFAGKELFAKEKVTFPLFNI